MKFAWPLNVDGSKQLINLTLLNYHNDIKLKYCID